MEIDAASNIIRGYDGRELEYDLLVSIPTNMGSDVIKRSGMGDDLHFVPTNKETLRSEKYENIWVIGDAANIPASKAGSVVHYAAETLIENIMSALEGKPLTAKVSMVTPPATSFPVSTRACSSTSVTIPNRSPVFTPSRSSDPSRCSRKAGSITSASSPSNGSTGTSCSAEFPPSPAHSSAGKKQSTS